MTRYHVDKEDGAYGICRAEVSCPFGDDVKHVESLQEAVKEAEYILARRFNNIGLKKSDVEVKQKNNGSDSDFEKAENESMFDNELYRNVRKMPALFVIDRDKHETTSVINEKAGWIFEEESKPTYKRDGTSITVDEDGKIWARRSVKKGKKAPENYMEAEVDPVTGHSFGLEPIEQSSFKKFYDEAEDTFKGDLEPGTYELVGKRINGNPEGVKTGHKLLKHGEDIAEEIPDMRNVSKDEAFDMLKDIFAGYKERGIEGVVWWGADGKRTKLRVKDFFGDNNRR